MCILRQISYYEVGEARNVCQQNSGDNMTVCQLYLYTNGPAYYPLSLTSFLVTPNDRPFLLTLIDRSVR